MFYHSQPKNYRSKFNFFELVSTCKKSVEFSGVAHSAQMDENLGGNLLV